MTQILMTSSTAFASSGTSTTSSIFVWCLSLSGNKKETVLFISDLNLSGFIQVLEILENKVFENFELENDLN